MSDSWHTSELNIFRNNYLPNNPQTYVYMMVGLKSIEWIEPTVLVCMNCGESANVYPCEHCGSVKPTSNVLGTANVILYSPIPYALDIFSFPVDTDFRINRSCVGDRRILGNHSGFIKLLHCEIIKRTLPHVNSLDANDNRLYLHVTIRCEVELFEEDG